MPFLEEWYSKHIFNLMWSAHKIPSISIRSYSNFNLSHRVITVCMWTASKNAVTINCFHDTVAMIRFENCFLGGPLCIRENHEEFLNKVNLWYHSWWALQIGFGKNGTATSCKQNVFFGKSSTAYYFFFHVHFSKRLCSDYSCDQYVPKYKKCVNNCLLGLGQSSHTCLIDTTEL